MKCENSVQLPNTKASELGVATKEGDFYNFEEGIDTAQIADELDISVDLSCLVAK